MLALSSVSCLTTEFQCLTTVEVVMILALSSISFEAQQNFFVT